MNINIRYLTFIISILLTFIFTSCSDSSLNVTPSGELSDITFWKTEEDAFLALVGAYRGWEHAVNIILSDAQSDNAWEQITYRPWSNRANGVMDASTTSLFDWGWAAPRVTQIFPYDRIRKYNNFLIKIEDIPMDDEKKEKWKAEVRFLRAYDYFNKVMFYGDMPLVTELIGPEEHLSRDPADEVKQFIMDELNEIIGILPVQNVLESGGRVTAGAAMALKARHELYMGRFEDAMASSKAVIDMGVYELYPDYRELFLEAADANNRESILEIQHIANDYPARIGGSGLERFNLPGHDAGWSITNALWSLISAYETSNGLTIQEDPEYDPDRPFDNRDPRLEMTVIYPGQEWNERCFNSLDATINGSANQDHFQASNVGPRSGTVIKKWAEPRPSAEIDNHGNNVMVIRLAEMYLTFAEAAVETGQNTDLALDYINEIRLRAGHVPATELTRELVRRERRVELAGEGLRIHDLKRWEIAMDVLPGPIYGVRRGSVNMDTCEVAWEGSGDGITDMDGHIMIEQRNFTERNLLYPIIQPELDANPAMTQNPGY